MPIQYAVRPFETPIVRGTSPSAARIPAHSTDDDAPSITRGMAVNRPPHRIGPNVFVATPRPATNMPMKTNIEVNGTAINGDGRSGEPGDLAAAGSRRTIWAMRLRPRPTPRGKLFAANSG